MLFHWGTVNVYTVCTGRRASIWNYSKPLKCHQDHVSLGLTLSILRVEQFTVNCQQTGLCGRYVWVWLSECLFVFLRLSFCVCVCGCLLFACLSLSLFEHPLSLSLSLTFLSRHLPTTPPPCTHAPFFQDIAWWTHDSRCISSEFKLWSLVPAVNFRTKLVSHCVNALWTGFFEYAF